MRETEPPHTEVATSHSLVLPTEFDEDASIFEAKGWLSGARLAIDILIQSGSVKLLVPDGGYPVNVAKKP